jgi:hypothetical protein
MEYIMKITNETLNILKNFSSINPSIVINEGNVLKTISPQKSILAKATINQTIENKMAIYDLSNFLSAMSVFDQPELIFNGNDGVTITSQDNKRGINYMFSDPQNIIVPPEKDIVLTDFDVQFTLEEKALSNALKAIGVLNLPEIAFSGDGKTISVKAVDSKKATSTYEEDIGKTDKTFTSYFKAENMKMITGTYECSVSSKGFAHFKGKDIEYWIAVEKNSTYN